MREILCQDAGEKESVEELHRPADSENLDLLECVDRLLDHPGLFVQDDRVGEEELVPDVETALGLLDLVRLEMATE
ncbi:hypothetical protein SAY86_004127 [Trapa natans]|uniref:Uncharacterized protein n=1 Tax=Trapa natans TaxID=22666 RepID=A0AAN7MY86_TRANT|nr:hypothetical protein SAY86_004127 [Trapa natans]